MSVSTIPNCLRQYTYRFACSATRCGSGVLSCKSIKTICILSRRRISTWRNNVLALKDIFDMMSSESFSASDIAACRYRSCEKLHMSLALWTSHPSAIAPCRPFIELRVEFVFDSLMLSTALDRFQDASESSSLPLLPLELSQSITRATSSALNLTDVKSDCSHMKDKQLTMNRKSSPILDKSGSPAVVPASAR